MRYSSTFQSPRSQAIIAGILALMADREYTTPRDIATALKMSDASASNYLKSLADMNQVVCIKRAVGFRGGSHPSRWKLATGADAHVCFHDPSKRRVVIVQQWEQRKIPPMFELQAYLFGRAA